MLNEVNSQDNGDLDLVSDDSLTDTRLIELRWEEVLGRLRARQNDGYEDSESLRAATQELLSLSASIRDMAKLTVRRSKFLRS